MDYSVLMSVYKNTDKNEFVECIDSLRVQDPAPKEIVCVIDGPVAGELAAQIEKYGKDPLFVFVPLEQNVGLGNALREGTARCSCEWIARMDSDDICAPDRMQKQVAYLESHPDVDVLGSNIAEFIGTKDNVVSERKVPEGHDGICDYLKKRCPFNHMTVFIRKTALEKAGGYLHWHYNEDSYLWVRMYLAGARFANIAENLVFARINEATFQRRGGYKYYKSERDLFKFMYKNKVIGYFDYLVAKTIRFVVQVLMPNRVRQWFFKTFARS